VEAVRKETHGEAWGTRTGHITYGDECRIYCDKYSNQGKECEKTGHITYGDECRIYRDKYSNQGKECEKSLVTEHNPR